jgi:hypothetical protein
VYVLGDFVDIQRRVSFPDFPYEGQDPTKPFNFDSQQWKHELPPHLTMPITGKADKPPQDLVAKIAKCLGGQLVSPLPPIPSQVSVLWAARGLFPSIRPADPTSRPV